MTQAALVARSGASGTSSVRSAAITLCICVPLWACLFLADLRDAWSVWISSTAYNHCFLIIPLALFLAYERRNVIRVSKPYPRPLLGLLALPLGILWVLGHWLGILELRQLAAMTVLQVVFLVTLGPLFYARLAAPLLYLFFLVPVGAFLTPTLQNVTVWFARSGLDLACIPNYADGFSIQIPEGTFLIAEACAGLRFLVASVAFGVFFALTMYRDVGRRLAFVLASFAVPVVANGFRAFGIIALGHLLGSAQAAATDHVVYGWVFFSLVLLVLIGLGMRFRQDLRFPPVCLPTSSSARRSGLAWIAAGGLALALGGVGPACAAFLQSAVRPLAALPARLAACSRSVDEPTASGADHDVSGAYRCPGGLRLRLIALQAGVLPDRFLAVARRATRQDIAENVQVSDIGRAPGWRLVRTTQPNRLAALLLLDGGRATGSGLASRLRLAEEEVEGMAEPKLIAVLTGGSAEALAAFVVGDDLDKELRLRGRASR